MTAPVRVGIIVGSESDLPVMNTCGEVLDGYGIGWEIGVMSAHRAGDVAIQVQPALELDIPAHPRGFADQRIDAGGSGITAKHAVLRHRSLRSRSGLDVPQEGL